MEPGSPHDQEPPETDDTEILEARIDTELLDLCLELEKSLPSLVESDDAEHLRGMVIAYMRAAYAEGVKDSRENPQLYDELKRIIGDPTIEG